MINNDVQVFIFNYGLFNAAHNLYKTFEDLEYDTYLLNCASNKDPEFNPTDKIIKLPNVYYSGQWNEALKLLNKKIMLIICSDIKINNPSLLMNKMNRYYKKYADKAGIYAPNADWTPWTYNPNLLQNLGNGCKEVVCTDSMIWSLTKEIAEKVGFIDTKINKIGWGIELLAGWYCKKYNKYVARDYSIKVQHPRNSTYNRNQADREFKEMIRKLPNAQDFWNYYNSRHMYGFGSNQQYNQEITVSML